MQHMPRGRLAPAQPTTTLYCRPAQHLGASIFAVQIHSCTHVSCGQSVICVLFLLRLPLLGAFTCGCAHSNHDDQASACTQTYCWCPLWFVCCAVLYCANSTALIQHGLVLAAASSLVLSMCWSVPAASANIMQVRVIGRRGIRGGGDSGHLEAGPGHAGGGACFASST
jgi:hypothetical protein